MANSFFSPKTNLNGGALFASFNSKDGSIFFKILKQVANNPDKKNNFDGKNPINFKLSQDEAADIIRSVRTTSACSFYHKFKEDVTTANFKYYSVQGQNGQPNKSGYGLTVKKNDIEVKIGFTLGSAERLSLFLVNALNHIYDQEHRDDMKAAEEYRKKEDTTPPKQIPSEQQGQSETEVDF